MKNPIYLKELKLYARSPRTAGILVIFNVALMIIGLFAYYISFIRPEYRGSEVLYSDILSIYRILATVEFALIAIVVPAISAGSICGEREKQTLELLLSTTLSPIRIVFGKLIASLHLVLLLLVSSLPVFGLVFSVGGIRIVDLMILYAELFLVAVLAGSISIFFSTCCKRTTTACVFSYSLLIILIVVNGLAVIWLYVLDAPVTDYVNMESVIHGWLNDTASHRDWNLLLLLNPLTSFLALLQKQTGETTALLTYGSGSAVAMFLREHWISCSMFFQVCGIVMYSGLSVRRLKKKN